jgi:ATP-dependent DNA helicase RecQ
VGQMKARQHGETFLSVIRAYCSEHDIAEKRKQGAPPKIKPDSGRRYVIVGKAFNEGQTVEQLMKRYNVMVNTIIEHLSKYVTAGYKLRPAPDLLNLTSVSAEQQAAALAAFDELGTDYLKPVFDQFEGVVSYEDLRIIRLCYLSQH